MGGLVLHSQYCFFRCERGMRGKRLMGYKNSSVEYILVWQIQWKEEKSQGFSWNKRNNKKAIMTAGCTPKKKTVRKAERSTVRWEREEEEMEEIRRRKGDHSIVYSRDREKEAKFFDLHIKSNLQGGKKPITVLLICCLSEKRNQSSQHVSC